MRPFQQSTREAVGRLAAEHGVSLAFETVPVEPSVALGHEPGDVYLRTTFSASGRSFDLFVYTNEAEANVESNHFSFELPDFEHDESKLREAYVWFLARVLAGADIIGTYGECRKLGASLTIA